MFNCLPAEKAIAICKRNFLNEFCVTNNELCKVFTIHAKKELATLLADIQLSLVKQLSFYTANFIGELQLKNKRRVEDCARSPLLIDAENDDVRTVPVQCICNGSRN